MLLFGTKGQEFLHCPGTKGQRDRSSFIVLGQKDNGTSSKSCHGTGRAGILTGCPVPSRPGTSRGTKMKEKILKKGIFFSDSFFSYFLKYFLPILLSRDVPGRDSLFEIPSRPVARFRACPVVPLSRNNEGTSVPLSQKKLHCSFPLETLDWGKA